MGTFPQELLDLIIDQSYNEKPTLKALALASRSTLFRSRIHLVSTITMIGPEERFYGFLDLVKQPWTSFSAAVKTLHLDNITRKLARDISWDIEATDLERILTNLPHVKTLRLNRSIWLSGTDLEQLFFRLNITHMELYKVTFSPGGIEHLFSNIPSSVKTMSLFDLSDQLNGERPLLYPSNSFKNMPTVRSIRLKHVDSDTLQLLQFLWKESDEVAHVDSFTVRLHRGRSSTDPFLLGFLSSVGPSLRHLRIDLTDIDYGDIFEPVDLSMCGNLQMIHIGLFQFESMIAGGMPAAMWNILNRIATANPPVKEIVFHSLGMRTPRPRRSSPYDLFVSEVKRLDWVQLTVWLRQIFPALRHINIGFGDYCRQEKISQMEGLLHDVPSVRELEAKGIAHFHMLPLPLWSTMSDIWRDVPTSLKEIGRETYNFGR